MITLSDRNILRELAKRVDEIARLPVMEERRKRFQRHNALERGLPIVLCYPEGSWRELMPESALQCEGADARRIERELRERIFTHERIGDDSVTERWFRVRKTIPALGDNHFGLNIDWGLPIQRHASPQDAGAYGFEPLLKDYDDLKKLRVPEVYCDEKATTGEYEQALDLFGDILDVKLTGVDFVSFHIMYYYTHYRGLEQTFFDFYDEPAFAHELIGFFERGYNEIVDRLEALDLLWLNNDGVYVSSGGFGQTAELPQKDFNGHVRPIDMWASAEAQEMAPVSPEQTEEFVISAERRLLSRFGLNGYGCCEGLHDKMPYVLSIPRIRRVSVSPFADVKKCAEQLGTNAVFSWKPSPFFVSGPVFDREAAREYIAAALRDARETVLEIILADTHTCHDEPERFAQWVKICREEIERLWS